MYVYNIIYIYIYRIQICVKGSYTDMLTKKIIQSEGKARGWYDLRGLA